MKLFKLSLYSALICCTALVCGAVMANPGPETAVDEALPQQAPELKAEPEAAVEVVDTADVANEDLARAEDTVDLEALFGSFLVHLQSELHPAEELDIFTPQTGWYPGICYPNFCQQCNTDANCTGSNRCRSGVQCP